MFRKKNKVSRKNIYSRYRSLLALLCIVHCALIGCSFDYGELEPTIDNSIPDLVMENVEYIRVRSSEPQAKFQAERAERYEELNIMIMENILFEQFGSSIEEINALGTAGSATVEIDTGNIILKDEVKIEIESEDIIIETSALEWLDEPRTLSSGEQEEVTVFMGNGGSFVGIGLFADALNYTWQFFGFVTGDYIFEDDENEISNEEEIEEVIEDEDAGNENNI